MSSYKQLTPTDCNIAKNKFTITSSILSQTLMPNFSVNQKRQLEKGGKFTITVRDYDEDKLYEFEVLSETRKRYFREGWATYVRDNELKAGDYVFFSWDFGPNLTLRITPFPRDPVVNAGPVTVSWLTKKPRTYRFFIPGLLTHPPNIPTMSLLLQYPFNFSGSATMTKYVIMLNVPTLRIPSFQPMIHLIKQRELKITLAFRMLKGFTSLLVEYPSLVQGFNKSTWEYLSDQMASTRLLGSTCQIDISHPFVEFSCKKRVIQVGPNVDTSRKIKHRLALEIPAPKRVKY